MNDLRKKLEALVEREAERVQLAHIQVSSRPSSEREWDALNVVQGYKAGANLLLDAVVEMQEALTFAKEQHEIYVIGKHTNKAVHDRCAEALSSLEKRIAEARASGEEK